MDNNQLYLLKLHEQTDANIESLRAYAEENHVPIVDRITLEMIKQVIRLHLSLIHISEPTRRTPISYAVFCLKKKSMPSSA